MTTFTVLKLNHRGQELTRYSGELLQQTATSVCLQATFERERADLGVVVFERGDRMIEWFYTDRWYNIFEVQVGQSGRVRGWYCNITRPAVIEGTVVKADDLEVDVFVALDGTITLLDEQEFDALNLPTDERMAVFSAIQALRQRVLERAEPFQQIP
jgi:predicted RNA-binding protein associated with RNAse of E/G family